MYGFCIIIIIYLLKLVIHDMCKVAVPTKTRVSRELLLAYNTCVGDVSQFSMSKVVSVITFLVSKYCFTNVAENATGFVYSSWLSFANSASVAAGVTEVDG